VNQPRAGARARWQVARNSGRVAGTRDKPAPVSRSGNSGLPQEPPCWARSTLRLVWGTTCSPCPVN
jgi:hypothetical protein